MIRSRVEDRIEVRDGLLITGYEAVCWKMALMMFSLDQPLGQHQVVQLASGIKEFHSGLNSISVP